VADDVDIVRGGRELLDDVRPLWNALREHHGAVAPYRQLRDEPTSWARRRAQYDAWLADGDAFVLLARDRAGGAALAYAFVRPEAVRTTTWSRDVRLLELETLSVAPAARGRGIGAALLERVRAVHDAGGYDGIQLTAVAGNDDALRFYEREGFAPMYVILQDTTRRR
jgi:GNAT superfamily N-acetyltransferase